MGEPYLWRTVDMSPRTCVVVKQMQSNPIPFAKSNGRFFQTQKNQHDAFIQFAQLFVDSVYLVYVSSQFPWKIYGLLALFRYAPRFKREESIIFISKLSLDIFINFMKWNFTDSDEILETLISTRCLNLVQIKFHGDCMWPIAMKFEYD